MEKTNRAAVLQAPDKSPIQIVPATYYTPGPHDVLIRTRAVAINPIDAYKQIMGNMMFRYLGYPLILGGDVSGDVVETGSAVTKFAKGDRVMTLALGLDPRGHQPQEGAWQEFVIARDHLVAKIPDSASYVDTSVIPLAACTAACGLFQKDQLALQYPRLKETRKSTGQTLVVWGASTSVGNNAVQQASFVWVKESIGDGGGDYCSSMGAESCERCIDGTRKGPFADASQP
ncbi:hypothetical protein G7046_g5224 [Stylonectria norvegica]|nr:hypothetical protein G7046_g5224 [Stylonectria norvegica]